MTWQAAFMKQRRDRLLQLLNDAWALLKTKPHYQAFNVRLEAGDMDALRKLEQERPQLGITDNGISTLTLLATVSEALGERRLAALVEDDGTIAGWRWYGEESADG